MVHVCSKMADEIYLTDRKERVVTAFSKNKDQKGEAGDEKVPLCSREESSYKLYKWRWIVLALFSLISMSNEVIWISLSSITSIVKDYYQVSSIAVNWLSIIFFLFYVFVIASTYILDKCGLKITIVIGAVLNAIGSCFRAIGSNRNGFIFIFLGNTFAALAQCFIMFIPPRLASVWFGDQERSTASSIGVLMNMFGVAIGFLLGGTMVPSSNDMENEVKHGMHRLLILQAVVCSVLGIASLFVIREKPQTPPSRSQELVRMLNSQAFVQEIIASEKEGTYHTLKDDTKNIHLEGEQKSPIVSCSHLNENGTNLENDSGSSNKNLEITHVPAFGESLLLLAKDKSFHLLAQGFGIYGSQAAVYSTLLNEMVVSKYPGREKEIGYMGFAAGVAGLFGIFFSGIILDKTRMYKSLSVFIFAACALLILLFTVLLHFNDNFSVLFISFCAFGLFSYAYLFAGLEHVAEITYPVPEGTTSGILFLLMNVYGIILTNIVGIMIRKCGEHVGGYIMTGFYIFGLVLVSLNSAKLKRSEVDHRH